MLKGLTRAGIGEVGSDLSFIQFASSQGFQAVDIDAKSFIAEHGIEQALDYLTQYNIVVGAFDLGVNWRDSEVEFQRDLPLLAERAFAASLLGCKTCCTYILPSTDQSPVAFGLHTVRRLKICAQILGGYGIQLALEFVGPHHLRTLWKHPFIHSMKDTFTLIDAIGLSNVSILLDSYHWYTNEMTLDDIRKLSAHQIGFVHINDAKNIPIPNVLDNDRLYPGEGVIDLTGFIDSLNYIGYQGIVSQEILMLTDNIPHEEAAARTIAGFQKLFTS